MYSKTRLLLRAHIVLNKLVSANGSGQRSIGVGSQPSFRAAAAWRRRVEIVAMELYTK
jgi:hypothetical protein